MPTPRAPRLRLPLALALVTAAMLLAGAGAARAAVVLESSEPAAGGSLAGPTHVDLRFSGPVDLAPDGVRLVGPDGLLLPVGEPEALADGTLRIPIPGTGTGLRALSWSGSAAEGGDPVSGSIAFDVGPSPTGALDVGGIAAAGTGAELGGSLVAVGLLAAAVAALLLARHARRRAAVARVPLVAVVIGAAAVALLGALLGLWMVWRGVSAAGAGGDDAVGLAIALVVAVAVAVAAAVLARAAERRWLLGLAVAVAAAGAALAVLLAPPLPDADAGSDKRILVDGGITVDVGLSPGAVGRNAILVSVKGAEGAADTTPALMLRPLDGSLGPLRVPLAPGADGALVADPVLLVLPGRWRGQFEGLPGVPEDDPALFDLSVQPNPGVTGG